MARRRRELRVEECRHLAGDAVDGDEVRPVVARLQLQDRVRQRQHVRERRPGLDPVWQEHDSGVIGAQLDLVLGEDHPVAELAPNLASFQLEAGRQDGSRQGNADGGARAEVPGAADDLPGIALADVHLAELQAVRVGMLDSVEHAAHAEEPEVAVNVRNADRLDSVDLAARDHEAVRDLLDRHLDRDVLPQPAHRHAHD